MNNLDNEQKNPIFNKKVLLDSSLLMNILMQMINCKQTSCIDLPEFRIDQLINLAIKCIIPITEKKMLDSICSIYILCLYYGLSTQYYQYNTFRFMSLLQSLLSESINIMFNFTNHCILMPPIIPTFIKSEHIEIEYMLEIFLECLEIGKTIMREFYKLMKVTLRIGQKYTPSNTLSIDERRIQMKHIDCIQPYSIYFMCTFAYSHLVIMLKSYHCLNIFPGSCECFLTLILTKYEDRKKPSSKHSIHKDNHNSDIAAIGLELASSSTTTTTATTIVLHPLKATVDVCMNKAYELALFVSHVIFDERALHELRLTHARITRSYQHPSVTFAKYCTSKIKEMLSDNNEIVISSTTSSSSSKIIINDNSKLINKNNNSKSITNHLKTKQINDTSNSNNHKVVAITNNKKNEISDVLSSNSNLIDLNLQSNYHFYRDKEDSNTAAVPSWQLYDPNDEDVTNISIMNLHITNKEDNISYEDSFQSTLSMKTTIHNNTTSTTTTTNNNNNSNNDYNLSNIKQTNQIKNNSLRNNNNHSNNNSTSTIAMHVQKVDQYWALGKIFRTPFILLDTIQNSTSSNAGDYFKMEYHPVGDCILSHNNSNNHHHTNSNTNYSNTKTSSINAIDGMDDYILHQNHLLKLSKEQQISLLPLTTSIKVIEAQYYEYANTTTKHRICPTPRFLNPTNEVYWICVYLIDYLHRQTCKGFGLHPPPQLELVNLKKQLKHSNQQHIQLIQHNASNNNNDNNNRINNDILVKDSYPNITKNIQITTGTSSTTLIGKKSSRKGLLNLRQRLQIAANVAAMETKADKLHAQIVKNNHEHIKMNIGDQILNNSSSSAVLSDIDIHKFEQEYLESSISKGSQSIVQSNASILSIVWTCKPKALISRKDLSINIEDEDDVSEITLTSILKSMKKDDKKNYIDKIKKSHQEQIEKENSLKQYYSDLQETLLSKIRTEKADYIRNQREELKNELQSKMLFKKEWLKYKEQQERNDITMKLRKQQEEEEKNYHELLHIQELKLITMEQEKNKKNEYNKIILNEKLKIDKLANKKEIEIITRRIFEEEQMKHCEQLRKLSEDRIALDAAMKVNQLKMVQLKAAELRDKLQARIRKGNFLWHHGKYGYYDNVRTKAVEWVQYEDSEGVPYYYDPLTKTSQYRIPADADYHHYTEDERKNYDAIHGDGAYDAYSADVAFKQSVNRDGGYWDPIHGFVVVNGHYDENGDFIADEGYYDDRGRYRLYAKVNGDLSFMV